MIGFVREEPEQKKKFITPKGKDLTILAEDAIFSSGEGGANDNVAVIGSTGSGKSCSVCESRLLHAHDTSLVIPIVKRRLFDRYAPLLESRGYEIWDLNMAHPERSTIGYDPCKGIKNGEDMIDLATAMVGVTKTMDNASDPYWGEGVANLIAAIFGLCEYNGDLSMSGAIKTFNRLEISYPSGHARTTLDDDFEDLEYADPDNQAPKLWRTLVGCAGRTASCLASLLQNAFGRLCCDYGKALFCKPADKMIVPKALGNKKIALFITTSTTPLCQKVTNLMYADIVKQLFEEAEAQGGALTVPVHLMFDDFSCGSIVAGFAEYVSVFRAARISCTILLQSLAQLSSMYGQHAATTILDNMDNLVFMGSLNFDTCSEFSRRSGMTTEEVLNMPVGDVIVSRRGWGTRKTRRYPTLEDDIYKEYIAKEPENIHE